MSISSFGFMEVRMLPQFPEHSPDRPPQKLFYDVLQISRTISETAQLLDIHRAHFNKLLAQLDIQPKSQLCLLYDRN
jgi:hypothetical protein